MSATLIIYPLDDSGQEVAFELDCDQVDIAMTLTVQDITDVTKRRGSFSKSITLAGTNANNAAFGYAYNIQSFVGGFTPNKRIRAALWDNGIQTFSGSLQLLSITKQGGKVMYDVAIFSEEVAFFRQINETLLANTAGVDDFDHTLSVSGVSGSWTAPAGSGYVYGFLDGVGYTDVVPSALQFFNIALLIPYLQLTPSFYVKQLVDLIFAQSGYRYQSEFFNSARFKKLVLPYAGGSLIQYDLADQNLLVQSDTALTDDAENWVSLGDNYFVGIIPIDTVISDPQSYWDTARFTFNNTGYYTQWDVRYVVQVTNSGASPINFGMRLCDKVTGQPLNPTPIAEIVSQVSPGGIRTFEFQGTVRIAPGQEVDLRLFYLADDPEVYPLQVERFATLSMVCTENLNKTPNVDMKTALPPDITQADLMSDLQKMFNLYFYQAPEDDKLIYIEPFNDFYVTGSVDWTQKVDQQGEHNLTMGDPQMRKTITFKYKDSGDALGKLYANTFSDGYGSREYKSENYYAKGEEVIETKCATVIPASYYTGLIIGRTFDIDSNNVPKQRATGYRIAQFNYIAIPSEAPWFLLIDLIPTAAGFTNIPFIGHIDNPYAPTFDLAFGMPKQLYYRAYDNNNLEVPYKDANLFKTYWLNYILETTSKEALQIELDVMLDPVDIYNLDFRKPIYIDGVLFRLLEIRDYVIGGQSKCRALLRRILNLAAPAVSSVPVLTYFDSSDLILGEQKPQAVQPNDIQ
jgi:hypothetical protein